MAAKSAPHMHPMSTRRLNRVVYSHRGLRLRKSVDLCQAEDFADAIETLTEERAGHRQRNPKGAQRKKLSLSEEKSSCEHSEIDAAEKRIRTTDDFF